MMLSPLQIAENIGYDTNDLNSIPEASILGVGSRCTGKICKYPGMRSSC